MAKQVWAAEIITKNLIPEISEKLFTMAGAGKPAYGVKRRGLDELFILSTDSHFVVYGVGESIEPFLNFFLQDPALYEHVRFYKTSEASITHLFATASGLCSTVKGSSQILIDIQRAHYAALKSGSIGLILDNLIRQSLRCSKKVRKTAELSKLAGTVVEAGMDLVFRKMTNIEESSFLVIGDSDIARNALEFFYHEGIRNVVLASEKDSKGTDLADEYSVRKIDLEEVSTFIHLADVVINDSENLSFERDFHNSKAWGGDKVMLDFRIRPGFHQQLRELPCMTLYTIYDINDRPETTAACFYILQQAWKMVEDESIRFLPILKELEVVPVLNACWNNIVKRGEQEISLLMKNCPAPESKVLELVLRFSRNLMRVKSSIACHDISYAGDLRMPAISNASKELIPLKNLTECLLKHLN
jgi:glutamyl-tRNA reductase